MKDTHSSAHAASVWLQMIAHYSRLTVHLLARDLCACVARVTDTNQNTHTHAHTGAFVVRFCFCELLVVVCWRHNDKKQASLRSNSGENAASAKRKFMSITRLPTKRTARARTCKSHR